MDSDGNALFNLVHNIESGGTAHCCLAPMMLAMQPQPVPPFPCAAAQDHDEVLQVRVGVGPERAAPAAARGQGPHPHGRGHRADRQKDIDYGEVDDLGIPPACLNEESCLWSADSTAHK